LAAGKSLSYEPDPARHLYLVPSAKVRINGIEANARDGVAISGEERITIEAEADAELVLVDAR
jgi:quercetin 2,3-dioxygenase